MCVFIHNLTYKDPVMPYGDIELVWDIGLGNVFLPYGTNLDKCWPIISEVLSHSPERAVLQEN